MKNAKIVAIDAHPHNALRYVEWDAIICIDIIRATSSLVTSVMSGRKTFSAASVDEAFRLARELDNPLLAGEIGGIQPPDFDIQNSPFEIAKRTDIERPLVLVSTSGTKLIANAASCPAVYVASFQNLTATAEYVYRRHDRVAVIGAGSRFEFRREDQMGTAWTAEKLLERGFDVANGRTGELVQRWSGMGVSEAWSGNSAAYLKRSNQEPDLDYVLSHFDDCESACVSVMNRIHAIEEVAMEHGASQRTVEAAEFARPMMLSPAQAE